MVSVTMTGEMSNGAPLKALENLVNIWLIELLYRKETVNHFKTSRLS